MQALGSQLHCPLICPLLMIGSSGLPTELSTVSLYGSCGQRYLHGKIPIGFQLSCPLFQYMEVVGGQPRLRGKIPNMQFFPLPACSPWATKWAALLFFPYGFSLLVTNRPLKVSGKIFVRHLVILSIWNNQCPVLILKKSYRRNLCHIHFP